MPRLGVFVTPHGFGHAARVSAVVAALARRLPDLELDLHTTVPEWFFAASLPAGFRYRPFACDVGLVQRDAVHEDLGATVAALERLWDAGGPAAAVARVAEELRVSAADAVLCDISPLGLAAARAAGLPAILLESFTWDWIYEGYLGAEPRLAAWIERLRPLAEGADLRLQAAPCCRSVAGARAVAPIARRPRAGRAAVRARLGIDGERPLVLVSFGGIETRIDSTARWEELAEVDFVVPGGAAEERREGHRILLPHRTPVPHPDLVAAADLVVGKLGYSTVAEAFAAGTRVAYLPRPAWRESAVLERFVHERLPALALDAAEFASGEWVARLPALLARPRPAPGDASGAEPAAEAIAALL